MNFARFLNADMATLAGWFDEGLTWWLKELRDMVPARLRTLLAPIPPPLATYDNGTLTFWRAAGTAAAPVARAQGPAPARAHILVPPSLVLERELQVPQLSDKDLRRMIALDIDRLTPFEAHDVYFDIVEQRDGLDRPRLTLGVLRRVDANKILASAKQNRIEIAALSVGFPAGGHRRYDFVPALRRGKAMPRPNAGFWWAFVAFLVVLNIFLLIWRDTVSTDALRSAVAAHQDLADLAARVHDRASAEAMKRRAFLAGREDHLPLPMLEALTKAVPAPSWVQTLDWDGRTVHIAGFKPATLDLLPGLVASHQFKNVKLESMPLSQTKTLVHFELSADFERTPP